MSVNFVYFNRPLNMKQIKKKNSFKCHSTKFKICQPATINDVNVNFAKELNERHL